MTSNNLEAASVKVYTFIQTWHEVEITGLIFFSVLLTYCVESWKYPNENNLRVVSILMAVHYLLF
jgi:hypothetical protein